MAGTIEPRSDDYSYPSSLYGDDLDLFGLAAIGGENLTLADYVDALENYFQ